MKVVHILTLVLFLGLTRALEGGECDQTVHEPVQHNKPASMSTGKALADDLVAALRSGPIHTELMAAVSRGQASVAIGSRGAAEVYIASQITQTLQIYLGL